MTSKGLGRALTMDEVANKQSVSSSRNKSVYAYIFIYAEGMINRDRLTVVGEKLL